MRQNILKVLLVAGITVILMLPAIGQEPVHPKEPALITSAGQSSDVLMAKILAQKAGIKFEFDKQAGVDKLANTGSVIIVMGGSVKGMGAAGIKKEEEFARVKSILEKAHEKDLTIIGLHVGGKSRRGSLSDYFNTLVSNNANFLAVVKDGNSDKFFTKIATERKIPLELPEKIIDIQQILARLYEK